MDPTSDFALPPDPQIVEALRSGDPRALEMLVREYREPLSRYAEGIIESPGGGDDVAQEVFIRLWTRREALSGEGSLRSLLYTMTRNTAIDERRRARRATERASMAPEPRPGPSPYESALEAELAERASRAVASLPVRRQEVFRLVRECGLSYEEVAGVMQISLQTVANHMSLALASLRDALASVVDEAAWSGRPPTTGAATTPPQGRLVEPRGKGRVMDGAHDVSSRETM